MPRWRWISRQAREHRHWAPLLRQGAEELTVSTENGLVGAIGPKLLLSVEEAAMLLSIGRTRMYQLVLGKQVPSVKVGRSRLVLRRGLEEYVEMLVSEQANC